MKEYEIIKTPGTEFSLVLVEIPFTHHFITLLNFVFAIYCIAVKIETTTKEYYQKRVEDILDWYPNEKIPHKSDLSGLGLQT